jgi:hypothetical protein
MEYYIVVTGRNLIELEDKVTKQIENGYIPQGGIFVEMDFSINISNKRYLQAMVKIKKTDEK